MDGNCWGGVAEASGLYVAPMEFMLKYEYIREADRGNYFSTVVKREWSKSKSEQRGDA